MARPVESFRWDMLQPLIAAHERMGTGVRWSPPTWTATSKLIRSCEAMGQAESGRLVEMYKNSKERLSPLSDPIDVLFPSV